MLELGFDSPMGRQNYNEFVMAGTVRKHHPRGQAKYIEMYREGQAKLEWESKERAVKEIKDKLLALPLKDRVDIFNQFCSLCGNNDPQCKCGEK